MKLFVGFTQRKQGSRWAYRWNLWSKSSKSNLLCYCYYRTIATNTTVERDAVKGLEHADEAGGLSGVPVFTLSNKVVRGLKAELGDALPIIGVGGIFSGEDAKQKIDAGASLIQLYSGLIYKGPALVRDCAAALRK